MKEAQAEPLVVNQLQIEPAKCSERSTTKDVKLPGDMIQAWKQTSSLIQAL